MILGALVELGAPLDELTAALKTLGLAPFTLTTERGERMHLTGLHLGVHIAGHPEAGEPADPLGVAHAHAHHHHHEPADHHHHHHDHRALSDIEALIRAAPLPAPVQARALAAFQALGRAEAKIHGVPLEAIHFHEVGADDSILDLVGCCWALHRLGIETVSVGPIPQGQGVIRCAHGVFPNPAPATQELLIGFPVVQTEEPFELVTPTGAALLATWQNAATIPAGGVLARVAYSLGRRELHTRPNALRASLYESADAPESDTCLVLECNLDDTTPELVGVLIEDALAAGALDAWCSPVTMKKQRPGLVLTVLCAPGHRDRLLDLVFRGSTTFGVREYPVQRTKLGRRFATVATPYGEIRIKIGTWRGADITHAPEMADCIARARETGASVRAVYEAALRTSTETD